MLQSLGQLTDLTVIGNDIQYDMVDGWTWSRLLKSIVTFKFVFIFARIISTSATIDLTSFRSSFWLEEKRWFVMSERCRDTGFSMLYSNQFCLDQILVILHERWTSRRVNCTLCNTVTRSNGHHGRFFFSRPITIAKLVITHYTRVIGWLRHESSIKTRFRHGPSKLISGHFLHRFSMWNRSVRWRSRHVSPRFTSSDFIGCIDVPSQATSDLWMASNSLSSIVGRCACSKWSTQSIWQWCFLTLFPTCRLAVDVLWRVAGSVCCAEQNQEDANPRTSRLGDEGHEKDIDRDWVEANTQLRHFDYSRNDRGTVSLSF